MIDDGFEGPAFADVLGEVMDVDAAVDAVGADAFEDALTEVLEAMSPAEAFGLTKAIGQIGRGAAGIVTDPAFVQVASGVLPVAGGAMGTVVGGPAGTVVGSGLGRVAAGSLARSTGRTTGQGRPAGARPSKAAAGSSAAARGLVLTQHPDVLKGLLALAMGEHGRTSVSGIPVAALMSMLSSVFGQAAADADELLYLNGPADAEDLPVEDWDDDGSLYTALLDADNAELADAVDRG